jgi:outer membrane protein assembly factor BamA
MLIIPVNTSIFEKKIKFRLLSMIRNPISSGGASGLIVVLLFLIFPGKVKASFQLPANSNGSVFVRQIDIEGNRRTRSSIILREMAIKNGDTLAIAELRDKLEVDRRKIGNLNLFITVDMETGFSQDSTTVDIKILVKERWFFIAFPVFEIADRNFNEWWYDRNRDFKRVVYGGYVSYRNVTGRADRLVLSVEMGFTPRYGISYSLPYIDKAMKTGVSAGFSYATHKTMPYRTWNDKLDYLASDSLNKRRSIIFVNITRRNRFYTFHSVDLRWSRTQLSDTIALLNPKYLKDGKKLQNYLQLTATYNYDKRDNVQYPLRGKQYGAQVSKQGVLPSDDINLFYSYGHFKYFAHLGGPWFASTSARAKISFFRQQPYLQTVGLGYRLDLVRGYDLYVIDGQSYALLQNDLKFRLFDIRKHFSWIPIGQFNTIPMAAYLTTYADAGYVKNYSPELSNSKLGNKLLGGAGAGLDFATFYNIVLRGLYAFNVEGEGKFFFRIAREF